MDFFHRPQIWAAHPDLAAGVLAVRGVHPALATAGAMAAFTERARARLAAAAEGELPEIQAWRRAFSRMGLKPTQYRCAAESLLRRFRKEGGLPRLHPLVDLCNAASLAFAIPVAVFDLAQVRGSLQVALAHGDEQYLAFSGEAESPDPGEVVFVDDARQVHARRWCHRQSAQSAIRAGTSCALIVAEAMHETAPTDVQALVTELHDALAPVAQPMLCGMLRAEAPRARVEL